MKTGNIDIDDVKVLLLLAVGGGALYLTYRAVSGVAGAASRAGAAIGKKVDDMVETVETVAPIVNPANSPRHVLGGIGEAITDLTMWTRNTFLNPVEASSYTDESIRLARRYPAEYFEQDQAVLDMLGRDAPAGSKDATGMPLVNQP